MPGLVSNRPGLSGTSRGRGDVGNGCNYLVSGSDVELKSQSAQEVVKLLR